MPKLNHINLLIRLRLWLNWCTNCATVRLTFRKSWRTLIAQDSTPVGITDALPGATVAVAMATARIDHTLVAKRSPPAGAASENKNKKKGIRRQKSTIPFNIVKKKSVKRGRSRESQVCFDALCSITWHSASETTRWSTPHVRSSITIFFLAICTTNEFSRHSFVDDPRKGASARCPLQKNVNNIAVRSGHDTAIFLFWRFEGSPPASIGWLRISDRDHWDQEPCG